MRRGMEWSREKPRRNGACRRRSGGCWGELVWESEQRRRERTRQRGPHTHATHGPYNQNERRVVALTWDTKYLLHLRTCGDRGIDAEQRRLAIDRRSEHHAVR